MSEFTKIKGGVTAPLGFKAAGVACGIKKNGCKDLALVFSETPALAAGIFTSNQMAASPVLFSCSSLAAGKRWQAVLINSGNANACTGKQGFVDVKEMAAFAASALKIEAGSVLVASTGVIGKPLPMEKVKTGIVQAVENLDYQGGGNAAEAILTTDAYPKEIAVELTISGKQVRLGGMAKGAGMIGPVLTCHPSLHATMLAVITTDARLSTRLDALKFLKTAVDQSFNCISVDGETSTNDSVFLLANGLSGVEKLRFNPRDGESELFQEALNFVCLELAKSIVKDGEGATKLITYKISGAKNNSEAKEIACSIAGSLLVKTAFFGQDPNWGRIMAAIGKTGVSVVPSKVEIYLGSEQLVKNGTGVSFDVQKVKKILAKSEIEVRVELNLGEGQAIFYGCDLNYDYVKLNAEYHT